MVSVTILKNQTSFSILLKQSSVILKFKRAILARMMYQTDSPTWLPRKFSHAKVP